MEKMNLIYSINTELISGKRYLVGYSLARESDDGTQGPHELAGPLPANLYTDDMHPCWVIREDGSLAYDPCPVPESEQLEKDLARLQSYLSETDWYVIRQADSGKPMPVDITKAREQVRNKISEIREQLEIKMEDDV